MRDFFPHATLRRYDLKLDNAMVVVGGILEIECSEFDIECQTMIPWMWLVLFEYEENTEGCVFSDSEFNRRFEPVATG